SLRVLIAEDNEMNRLLLEKVFAQWKLSPAFAENGQVLIDKLKDQDFDLVLMDIHMPLMDGYEATRQIRAMPDATKANIPIIALTASASSEMHEKIKSVGMNRMLLKPFQASELLMILLDIE